MFLKTVQQAKRFIIILIGFTLVLLGIVGWALPVVPGWALFLPGLAILAAEFVWARRLLDHLKAQGTRIRNSVFNSNKEKPSSAEPPSPAP